MAQAFLNGGSVTSINTNSQPPRDPNKARNKGQVLEAIVFAKSRAEQYKGHQPNYQYPGNSIKAINDLQARVKLQPESFVIHCIEELQRCGLRLRDCPNVTKWIHDALWCGTMISCHSFGDVNQGGLGFQLQRIQDQRNDYTVEPPHSAPPKTNPNWGLDNDVNMKTNIELEDEYYAVCKHTQLCHLSCNNILRPLLVLSRSNATEQFGKPEIIDEFPKYHLDKDRHYRVTTQKTEAYSFYVQEQAKDAIVEDDMFSDNGKTVKYKFGFMNKEMREFWLKYYDIQTRKVPKKVLGLGSPNNGSSNRRIIGKRSRAARQYDRSDIQDIKRCIKRLESQIKTLGNIVYELESQLR